MSGTVTTAATTSGLATWAQRIAAARATDDALVDLLGGWASDPHDLDARLAFIALAHVHGLHARLWSDVTPVLHDVEVSARVSVGVDALRDLHDPVARVDALREVETVLDARDAAWTADATWIAEAPYLRVLELVRADRTRVRERLGPLV